MGIVDEVTHRDRMKALIQFTSTSLSTRFPSPFGAAIYDKETGHLIAQAYDTVMQFCDPTHHAEINAIRLATQQLKRLSLRGSILYSTCEPCPMCMSACIWAEIDTVVYGAFTAEDAHAYWPQVSKMTPHQLVDHMRMEPKCTLISNVERKGCQTLFQKCDQVRQQQGLEQPPHR